MLVFSVGTAHESWFRFFLRGMAWWLDEMRWVKVMLCKISTRKSRDRISVVGVRLFGARSDRVQRIGWCEAVRRMVEAREERRRE